MKIRSLMVVLGLMMIACSARADVPRPVKIEAPPPNATKSDMPRLVMTVDAYATTASLILPKKLAAAQSLPNAAPGGFGPAIPWIGVPLASLIIVAALLVILRPRLKYAVCVLLPLGIALFGVAVHAQTARIEAPQTTIERGKIRISRGSGAELQLILPKRSQ